MSFMKATKKQSKLRLAIDGPSGSGKTWTALTAATALAGPAGKIAVIDTERGSASLYSDHFSFDVLELHTFSPQVYVDAIEEAEAAGYPVIVIDSLSHAWEGEGGALDLVDQASRKSQSNNSYFAWKNVTPLQRKLIDTMLQSPAHIITTMRSKTEYVIEEVVKDGRKTSVPRKIGMAPVQRAGIEYEFTIFADMDLDHNFMVTKSRFDAFADKTVNKPGVKFFTALVDWLNAGEPNPPATSSQPAVRAGETSTVERISLATAEAVISKQTGKTYGELTDEELTQHLTGIVDAITKNHLAPDRKADLEMKKDAIQAIQAARAAAQAAAGSVEEEIPF